MGSVQPDITAAGVRPAVYVAIELSKKSWLVALRGPAVDRISLHRLAVGDAAGLLALIERFRQSAAEATGTEVAVLAPTGGTTASPKAVMLTHRNLVANAIQLRNWCGGEDGTEGVLGVLPLRELPEPRPAESPCS